MALRRSLVENRKSAVEKEVYYLISWPGETSCSVHGESQVRSTEDSIYATFKGKEYEGKMVYKGSKDQCVRLEELYVKGHFTPFEDDIPDLTTKSPEPLPKKHKTLKKKPTSAKKLKPGKENKGSKNQLQRKKATAKGGQILDHGDGYMEQEESKAEEKASKEKQLQESLTRERHYSQHAHQMQNQRVDVSNSEQDDHMIKRKLPGGEDKYPQDKISEQGTDGVDLRDNKGDNQVMKRQSVGCGDKYPQDEVPEQQADGGKVYYEYDDVKSKRNGGDYGDSYMERVEDSENQKWLLREQGSQHSYQMLNQRVDVRDGEQSDHVVKRQLTGGGDRYPQEKIPEQRADGGKVYYEYDGMKSKGKGGDYSDSYMERVQGSENQEWLIRGQGSQHSYQMLNQRVDVRESEHDDQGVKRQLTEGEDKYPLEKILEQRVDGKQVLYHEYEDMNSKGKSGDYGDNDMKGKGKFKARRRRKLIDNQNWWIRDGLSTLHVQQMHNQRGEDRYPEDKISKQRADDGKIIYYENDDAKSKGKGGDYGHSYMERVESSENQKWLMRGQGSQHSYQMLNQRIDLSDSEQEDYVMKRQSAGGGDKYPQDKVPEQRADGGKVYYEQEMKSKGHGGDYGDSFMERVEDSENQKWLMRGQGSQHSYQMLNQRVDVRKSEQDDQVIKRRSTGGGDKYPQETILERRTDGGQVLYYESDKKSAGKDKLVTRPYGFSGGSQDNYLCDDSDSASTSILSNSWEQSTNYESEHNPWDAYHNDSYEADADNGSSDLEERTLHTMLKDAFKKIGRLENKLKATKYSSVVNKDCRSQNSTLQHIPDTDRSFGESDESDSFPIMSSSKQDDLIKPSDVVRRYESLLVPSRLPTLSVKLARESFFGQQVLDSCTVCGSRGQDALPPDKLESLKKFMKELSCPRFFSTAVDFEVCWKACLVSIGQACKNSRSSRPKKKRYC